MKNMKKFKISINNPMSEEILYVESTEENPLFEGDQLNNFGFVILMVSDKLDMSEPYSVSISPKSCSLIKIEKVKE